MASEDTHHAIATKEKDEANSSAKNDLAAIEDNAAEQYNLGCEVGGFDVACVDLMEKEDEGCR